ncbi:MAG TPA: VOC family protein [Candidatus Saccharimonadales bacterium]|nr:VOC family protein [Candidatus Saccharimonadales bacterium]
MTQLSAYLTFNGNCKEAMEFYKACLGGELTLNTVGESPMAASMPDKKDQILHSMLKSDAIILMASDMVMAGEVKPGNTVTLCIHGGTKEELQTFFTKLSEGGKVTHELKEEFFGTYGDLTDKYGFQWAFQADTQQS